LRLLSLFLAIAAPASALVVGYNPVGSTTFGDPTSSPYVVAFNQVDLGVNLNGEVLIESGVGTCTGSLLSDGESILTAAHCLDPSATASGVFNGTVNIYFNTSSGWFCGPGCSRYDVTGSSNFYIDPAYLADNGAMCNGVPCASLQGDDLAVIRLGSPAPSTSVGYSLYTGSYLSAFGPTIELAGAGYTGQGCIGGTLQSDGSCAANSAYNPEASAVLRQGQNIYGGTCTGCTNMLVSQFSGNSCVTSPASTTCVNPVDVAPGDSGGGSFLNGQLVGVHDFISCNTGDCAITGSTFFADTFVGGSNAAWIQSVEVGSAPEPGSLALAGLGAAVLALMRRRLSPARD
jgi:Trypsin/PEP-CTERM motif